MSVANATSQYSRRRNAPEYTPSFLRSGSRPSPWLYSILRQLSCRQVQCAPRSFASIHPIIGVSGVSDRLKGFSKLTDGIIKLVLLRAKHRKCMFSNSRRYSQWSEKSGSALWLVTSYLPCVHVVTSVTKSNLASVPSSKLSFKTVVA